MANLIPIVCNIKTIRAPTITGLAVLIMFSACFTFVLQFASAHQRQGGFEVQAHGYRYMSNFLWGEIWIASLI